MKFHWIGSLASLIACTHGVYIDYTVVSGDTQSSIAASHNISPAAIKLANPQLSDQDYGLPGEVVQIPASCSDQTNVHIAVPGDTISDIAKDYNVDLAALEKANPQITDPSTLNPGDCLQIPSGSSSSLPPSSVASSAAASSTSCDSESMTTTASYTSTWTPLSSPASTTQSVPSTTSYSTTAPTVTSCMFTIMSSGDISCPAGQLSDGQIRLNGSYPSAQFTISNSQITDSSGRGCIITAPPETQVQCDAGKTPASGFVIASDGTLSYNSSDTFYACPATDTEYNIYIAPNFGQKKCFSVKLTASGCGAAPATSSSSLPSSPPQTQTETTLQTVWQTITSTTTSNCSSTASSMWTNSSSSVYSSPTNSTTCPCETEKGHPSSSSTSNWWHSTAYKGYLMPTTSASN